MSVKRYKVTPPTKAVATVVLSKPIEEIDGGPVIDTLYLRNAQFGDLRRLGLLPEEMEEWKPTLDHMGIMLSQLSGHPLEIIDMMSLADVSTASEALGEVLGKSEADPGSGSPGRPTSPT